mmetsp:Transcript_3660/g.8173  ORF Transcript_3660/g.8173 Transcript_3660/m.8173 type:complete len:99 (-) Transcript_3660:599-895(-)
MSNALQRCDSCDFLGRTLVHVKTFSTTTETSKTRIVDRYIPILVVLHVKLRNAKGMVPHKTSPFLSLALGRQERETDTDPKRFHLSCKNTIQTTPIHT